MSLIGRVGRSFADEFKRPATLALLIMMVLFISGAILQVTHGWTNTNRPVWVDVLWGFSPAGLFPFAAQPFKGRAQSFWKCFFLCIVIHGAFLVVYCALIKGFFPVPSALFTYVLLGVGLVELGLLTYITSIIRNSEQEDHLANPVQ